MLNILLFVKTDGFDIQCRTMSKPYDIFGTWYSDMFFFSGNLHWLGNMVSKSVIWINKASQESQSEHAAVMNELYRFHNPKASSVRSLMIANCVPQDDTEPGSICEQTSSQPAAGSSKSISGNQPSNLPLEQDLIRINSRGHRGTLQGAFQNWRPLDNIADINYSEAIRSNKSRKGSARSDMTVTSAAAAEKPAESESIDDESRCSSMEDLLSDDSPSSPEDEIERGRKGGLSTLFS